MRKYKSIYAYFFQEFESNAFDSLNEYFPSTKLFLYESTFEL